MQEIFHEVSQTLLRYASAVDHGEWDVIEGLFTEDAEGYFGTHDPLIGRSAIIEWMRSSTAGVAWQHHLLSVYHVEPDGPDAVSTLTYHTSHQVLETHPDEVKLLVGRYYDRLRCQDGKWLISRKELRVGWRETRPRELRSGS